jgi:hypothetical protein
VNQAVPVAMQASQVQIAPRCATKKKKKKLTISLEKKSKAEALQIAAYCATWTNLLQINANYAHSAQKKCWDMNLPIVVP